MINKFSRIQKIIFAGAIAASIFFLFSQTIIGERIYFPGWAMEKIKDFLSENELSAKDYKDGTIILIKPVATGVGEGRYEAGDVVEIRDGEELYKRFGEGNFLGREEQRKLLPLYYPGKLTEEEKQKFMEPENKKRRQYGIDYTQILSEREILKIRNAEKLDRIPEINLSQILKKSSDQPSMVNIAKRLAKIEKARNTFKKIIAKIIPFVYAGTGGTKTICTSGCDYTTLNLWEAGEQGVLASPAIAQITEGFQDTVAVTIDGWTTTAANYIYIYTTAAARHDGKWNASKYRLECSTVIGLDCLSMGESYVKIDGLQISVDDTALSSTGIGIEDFTTFAEISNCIIRATGSTSNTRRGINTDGGGEITSAKIWNTIIYDFIGGSSAGINIDVDNATFYIYNTTIHTANYGILRADWISTGSVIAKNNLFKSCTTAAYKTFAAGTDYNATNNASMGYTVTGSGNTHDRLSQTFSFVDEAGDDFHLALSDLGARGYGLSQYVDANLPVTNDIDGNYRRPNGEVTDIGADEDIDTLDGVSVRISNIQQSGTRYTTLSGWEAGRNGDITGYYPEVAQIDGAWTAADTTAVTIDGWTTSEANYIYIYTTAAARHDGKWNTGKYRLEISSANALVIQEENTRIDGLQVLVTPSANLQRCIRIQTLAATANIYISNNVIRMSSTGTYTLLAGINVYDTAVSSNLYIWNNIIYDILGASGSGIKIDDADWSAYWYNNTIHSCITGLNQSTGTLIAKNNLLKSCTTAASGTFVAGTDYNATNNASMGYTVTGGGNTHDRLEQTFTFVNEDGDDFHLASDDAGAKDQWGNVYADANLAVTTDVDADARPNGLLGDIGADECHLPLPASGGGTPKYRIKGNIRIKGGVEFR